MAPSPAGRRAQVEVDGQLVGRAGDKVSVEGEHLSGLLAAVEERTGEHGGAEVEEPELEVGDDPEVASAPANRPKEVFVLIVGGTGRTS